MRGGATWQELARLQAYAEAERAPLCKACKKRVKADTATAPCLLCGQETETDA